MGLKDCNFCGTMVPERGQCSSCGFIDGIRHNPSDLEFERARAINQEHNHPLFKNLDMLLLEP